MSESLMNVPEAENIASKSLLERIERSKQALNFVNYMSNIAGTEIPIVPAQNAESIPQESGIYILPDYYDADDPVVRTRFINNPSLLSGRADSAHSVLAGELVSKTKSGEEKRILVAAKCALKRSPEERHSRAVKELGIMATLYEKGELAFKPIALAISPNIHPMNEKLALFSRFDPTINTMDNLPWGRGIEDTDNVASAVNAARSLGYFNAHLGYLHDDAKIKNCAYESVLSRTGFVDFETSEIINPHLPYDASKAASLDFDKLVGSLSDKGFFKHPNARQVLEEMAYEYLFNWMGFEPEIYTAVETAVEEIKRNTLSR